MEFSPINSEKTLKITVVIKDSSQGNKWISRLIVTANKTDPPLCV